MSSDFRSQLSASAKAFKELVWPIVGSLVGGGDLIHVEAVTLGDFRNDLDTLAGIDAWQVIQGLGIRGIASRVQPQGLNFNGRTWETFTIRSQLLSGGETEYQKRLRAIENPEWGLLCPHLTIHSYTSEDWKKLFAIAHIKTRDLITFIRDHPELRYEVTVQGGNHMFVVKWKDLNSSGVLPSSAIWRFDETLFL